jgi:uncharacterized protein YcfJ
MDRAWAGIVGALCAMGLAGCEAMGTAAQSKTAQGAVTGGVLGAGAGAIIGHQQDKAGEGAAIGAGLGALGGGLVGHALEEQERRLQPQAPAVAARLKVCPVDGKIYPESAKYCPEHGVQLQEQAP